MSIQVRNQTSGVLERVAGFNDTDSILSPSSKNPISNKAVYNALLQKIDKTVTDLVNYYDKSQVYTKPEVRALIGSINTLTIEVVSELPTQDISTTTIYFVGPKIGTNNYDEYVYVGGNWVQIGDTTIDLSNYVTSTNLTTVLQSYYTKSQTDALFNDYYDKDAVDDLLDTKQDTLTFDNTPTSGSSNPVTSTGIKTAINNAIVSSAGGSIIKVHHLDGSVVAGDTVTASKGSFSVSTTFDNNGDAIITGVGEIGTITITATNGTDIGVAFISAPNFSLYSTTISYGVNYKSWLEAGGLNPSSYSSLDEVLEDEEAIRRLFTIHASVDYLTAAIITDDNEDAIKIFNNDLCAKWISLRDYAMDTLPTNEHIASIMNDVDKYGYGEWALMPQVPIMTSNTAPYGEAINSTGSSTESGYEAYKAFDGSDSTYAIGSNTAGTGSGPYIGYHFVNAVRIRKLYHYYQSTATETEEIKYSDDGITWTSTNIQYSITSTESKYIDIPDCGEHSYWGIFKVSSIGNTKGYAKTLQFYAWQPKGNVPTMTSDTAPYGTAISSAPYSGMEAYRAFNGLYTTGYASNSMSTSAGDYLGYKFTNPVNVKRIFMYNMNGNLDGWRPNIKFQYSDDGSTWLDIDNGTIIPFNDYFLTYNIQNDAGYHFYWRVYKTSSSVTGRLGAAVLQFYGREMKVSVPAMTSDTTPYGTVTKSSQLNSTFNSYQAFDGKPFATSGAYGWLPLASDGFGNAYVQYEFIKPTIINYVACGYNDTSRDFNVVFKVYGSKDNTTWNELEEVTAVSYCRFYGKIIANPDYYKYYRFKVMSSDQAITNGNGYKFNLYGFDYSERDWDTEYPMHYIYDHGVELETLTLGSTVSKEESQIITNGNTTSANTLAYTNNIDLSSYSLLRLNIGNKFKAYGGMYVSNTDTVAWDASTWLGNQQWSTVNYPTADAGLDISLINLSKKVGFGTGGAADRQMSVTEFWLE